MENEEPSTLQSHKHKPPGKTVKQLFTGNPATQRAARPLKENRRGRKKPQQLLPRLGQGVLHLQGLGSAIPQPGP